MASENKQSTKVAGKKGRGAKKTSKAAASPTDAILPMTDDYMQQIVRREKTYEFRRYRISASVKRIWFYLNAPRSAIVYICDIDPACTREPGDAPLPEDGLGNAEFNLRHKDWDKYDFAYRVRNVRQLAIPINLAKMKEHYGIKGAPRGLVYVPPLMFEEVPVDTQKLLWSIDHNAENLEAQEQSTLSRKRKIEAPKADGPPAKQIKITTMLYVKARLLHA
jgi:predicted transcriptional regulator